MRKLGAVLVGVVVLQVLFALSYLGAFHNPQPHGLKLAVTGPAAALNAVTSAGGDAIDAYPVTDEQAARDQVERRDAVAALVVGASGDKLIVASAASPSQAALLEGKFQAASAQQHRTLAVEDLAALPTGDSRGVAPFYLTLVMVFGGYLGVVVFGLLSTPAAHRTRAAAARLATMAGYSLISAIAVVMTARAAFGVFAGHELAVTAAAALVCFATATIAISLQALLGVMGTGAVLVLFVIAGNPASGGAVPYGLMPEPYRTAGQYLVNGAGVDLIRNLTYFSAHAVARPLLVLALWSLVGTLLALTLGARRARKLTSAQRARELELEAELAPAVAAAL